MEPGMKLVSKVGIPIKIKGKYPSGQIGYSEDKFLLDTPAGQLRLGLKLLETFFEKENKSDVSPIPKPIIKKKKLKDKEPSNEA